MVEYDEIWSRYWGDVQRFGPSHRIHRHILKQTIRGLAVSSVMEVGCGNGVNLLAVREVFPAATVSAADISSEALAQLRTLLPDVRTVELDITREAPEGTFDLVLCFDVLEHIPDDAAALRNLARATGKYLFVSTLEGRMREFEREIGHVRNYRPGELQRKMSEAGLRVVKTINWGWPLYSPWFRDYLDRGGGQRHTTGRYGPGKRLLCHLLYAAFLLVNSRRRGDMLFVLAEGGG